MANTSSDPDTLHPAHLLLKEKALILQYPGFPLRGSCHQGAAADDG